MQMIDLSAEIAGIRLQNPVLTASGTFASGREYGQFVDLNHLGAVVAKTVTLEPREGNPPPRIWETPSGMLNAIGLQNPGIESFIEKDVPFLKQLAVPFIVSIAGRTVEEYSILASRVSREAGPAAIEVNISCPNVKAGGVEFGVNPRLTAEVIEEVAGATELPVIAKLSPNVTSIVDIAVAAAGAGASALSLINTMVGMAIDVEKRRPRLSNGIGGLSGPAIRPVAVRMVWQLRKALPDIPIIGMGGITCSDDALEFIMAGANAIAVGTSNFTDPAVTQRVIDGLTDYCTRHGVERISDLVGIAQT